jgi:DNA-binding response OmpR family regulator
MSKTILITEDDVQQNKVLEEKLNKEGFETADALDGDECITKGQEFLPNLILLDLFRIIEETLKLDD